MQGEVLSGEAMSNESMQEPNEIFRSLLKDVNSYPEEKMCVEALSVRLKRYSAQELVSVLGALYDFSNESPMVRKVKVLLIDPETLNNAIGEDGCKQAYTIAIDGGFKKVSRLFTDLPPHKVGPFGYDKEEEAKMEFITLGQRRAMAKSGVKNTLDRLLSDPDPIVVNSLLDNPRIIERDIVKIASKRPNSPHILRMLSTHRKWGKRYDIMKAIVSNPYSFPRISVALIDFMLTQDLKEVADDGMLHPQLKMSARELLEERTSLGVSDSAEEDDWSGWSGKPYKEDDEG